MYLKTKPKLVKDAKITGTIKEERKRDKNLFFTNKVTVFANNMLKFLLAILPHSVEFDCFTDVNNGSNVSISFDKSSNNR